MAVLNTAFTFLLQVCLFFAGVQRTRGSKLDAQAPAHAPPIPLASCDIIYNDIPQSVPTQCKTLIIQNANLDVLTATTFDHLNVTHITTLNISGNEIEDIKRSALRHFTSLSVLDASSNDITCIYSQSFENMTTLSQLYLQGNKIDSIDDHAFDQLTELRTLRLDDNRLTSIQTAFHSTPELVSLNLTLNRISHIAPNAFRETARMEELLLGYNHLTQIPSAITSGSMRKLKTLNLMSNDINTALTTESLNLEYLHELYLSNNHITTISKDAFDQLDMLEVLHLDLNQLTTFEVWEHSNLQNLQVLLLDQNRWHCNCSDMAAWESLQRTIDISNLMLVNPNKTTCFTPLASRGTVTFDFIAMCQQSDKKLSPYIFIIIGLGGILIFLVCLSCCCYCRRRMRSHNVTPTAMEAQDLSQQGNCIPPLKHEYMTSNGRPPCGGTRSVDGNHNQGDTSTIRSAHIYDYAKVQGEICRDPSYTYVNSQLLRLKMERSNLVSTSPNLPKPNRESNDY